MSESTDERRKHPRLGIEIKVQVQILLPEATFTPVILDACIVDISAGGARIRASNLSSADYRKIIRGPRLTRIITTLMPGQQLSRLFGKILNFEFHGGDAGSTCMLGIQFGENEERDLANLGELLRSIEARHEHATP